MRLQSPYRSDISHLLKGERAFHIFYQLLEGASPELKKELHLKSAESFEFLSASGCTSVPSLNDKKEFEDLVNALDTYKIDRDDQEAMWRVVSAIVHLSNLPFIAEGPNNLAALKNKDEINIIGELMEVEPQVLEDAILRPRVKAGGRDVVKTHLDKDKAHDSMEALAKSLHHRLFLWLVKRINKTLCQEMRSTYIGVLDIAGFEIFDFNNFEQLLINYTNERLQQFFNHHMFNLEQEEYEREQIEWTFIDFGMDSEPVINLIEKKPGGLLALLDEECHLGKVERGDTNFLQKLNNHFSKHEKYQAPRFKSEGFQVIHYAGIVEYTTGMWLDKNRDPLADDIVSCLLASENRFISRLFQEGALPIAGAASKAGGARKKGAQFTTVAAQHKEQLLSLMATLNSTYPHFIRCIIPNEKKTPGVIDDKLVLDQLRCNGVLEGIRISRKGFPNRIVYAEFLKRYYLLDPKNKVPRKTGDAKGVTKTLLEAIKMDAARYRYGLTKVFFKAGALAELEEMRERKISELILTVQAACRGWGDRRKFRIMHSEADAALAVQTNIRAWLRFKKWGWWSLFCKARPLLKRRNFEKEVEERERAINELKAQLQRETDERAKLDARAKELQEHLEKLSVDIEDAQEQLRDCNEDKDRLGKAKRDLEDEVDGLRADVDDLESAKEKAKRNASSLDEELDDIKDKLDDETKARARAEEARKLLEADLEKEQTSRRA